MSNVEPRANLGHWEPSHQQDICVSRVQTSGEDWIAIQIVVVLYTITNTTISTVFLPKPANHTHFQLFFFPPLQPFFGSSFLVNAINPSGQQTNSCHPICLAWLRLAASFDDSPTFIHPKSLKRRYQLDVEGLFTLEIISIIFLVPMVYSNYYVMLQDGRSHSCCKNFMVILFMLQLQICDGIQRFWWASGTLHILPECSLLGHLHIRRHCQIHQPSRYRPHSLHVFELCISHRYLIT